MLRSLPRLVPLLIFLTAAACTDRPHFKKDERTSFQGVFREAVALQGDRSYEDLGYSQFGFENGQLFAARLNEDTLQLETVNIGILTKSPGGMGWELKPSADLGQQAVAKPAMASMMSWFDPAARIRVVSKNDSEVSLTRSLNGKRDQITWKRVSTDAARGALGKVTANHELLAQLAQKFVETLGKETFVLKEQVTAVVVGGRETESSILSGEKIQEETKEDGQLPLVRMKKIRAVGSKALLVNGKHAATLRFLLLKKGAGKDADRLVVEMKLSVDGKVYRAEDFLGAFTLLDNGGVAFIREESQGRGSKRTVRRTYIPASQVKPTETTKPVEEKPVDDGAA